MKITTIALVGLFGWVPGVYAGDNELVNGDANVVSTAAPAAENPRACEKLLKDLQKEFGFDGRFPEHRVRSRMGNPAEHKLFGNLSLVAMAKDDGSGQRETIMPKVKEIEGSHDIIAKKGSSTLRTRTGWADKEKKVPLYLIQLYTQGKKVEILSSIGENGTCKIDNFMVYPAKDHNEPTPDKETLKKDGLQFSSFDCQTNTIDMKPNGKLEVNKSRNIKDQVCNTVWGYF